MSEDKLKELFKHFESQGAVVIADQITKDGNLHIPLDFLTGQVMSDTERELMKALLDMARSGPWKEQYPWETGRPFQYEVN